MSGKQRSCVVSELIREFEDKLGDKAVEEEIISVGATAYSEFVV